MKRIAKYVVSFVILVGVIVGLGTIADVRANAQPVAGIGCENVGWGINLFGNWTQRRLICDGVKRADGSWNRVRIVYTPAGYVPSYCSQYSCRGGYYRDETQQEKDAYVVNDFNVLANEPAWLPPGTDRVTS